MQPGCVTEPRDVIAAHTHTRDVSDDAHPAGRQSLTVEGRRWRWTVTCPVSSVSSMSSAQHDYWLQQTVHAHQPPMTAERIRVKLARARFRVAWPLS